MAQQFQCVVDDCDFTARGETETEVIERVERHRRDTHPDLDVSEDEIRQNMQTV